MSLKNVAVFLYKGISNIIRNKYKVMMFIILSVAWAIGLVRVRSSDYGMFTGVLIPLFSVAYAIATLGAAVFLMLLCGLPKDFVSIRSNIQKVGLTNAAGEPPLLIDRRKADNGNSEIWTFEAYGIPFTKWSSFKEHLESALDAAIVEIAQGKDGRKIELKLVQHPGPWPDIIRWERKNLPEAESKLALGENRMYPVIIDLSEVPHYLIAGRSGSGKSVLMKILMLQCAIKQMKVYLIDYKGGIDYAGEWQKYCEPVYEDEGLESLLDKLVLNLKQRLELLRASGSENIDRYNRENDVKMQRIAVFFDEVAEALDKTGADKVHKDRIAHIESNLATLCRLGRAAGIHIFLATQRGSSDVLSGQIRNNVFKIVGACDENLSLLTIGTTDAAKMIPETARGRFVDEQLHMFQGYYSDFSCDEFKKRDY